MRVIGKVFEPLFLRYPWCWFVLTQIEKLRIYIFYPVRLSSAHRKKYSQRMGQMYNGREDLKNILRYVDFTRICNFKKEYPKLNHNILKEGITLTL